MNRIDWVKYWSPSLPLRRIYERINYLKRFILDRYPLSDSSNSLSCDPLFIISAGRSGTTLLRSMLVAGGDVAIPAETQNIHLLIIRFPFLLNFGWERMTRAVISDFEGSDHFHLWHTNLAPAYRIAADLPVNERSLARIIDIVYTTYALQNFPNAKLWGDQSPIHTYFLPYIIELFPNARFLHMVRDGRDVVSSMIEKEGDQYLKEAIHRWKASIKITGEYKQVLSENRYLEIRYENLVQSPQETLFMICDYLNINFKADMLNYWEKPSTNENKHFDYHKNIGKPVFSSSVGKWKDRLSEDQKKYVFKNLKPELEMLGYLD